MSDVMIETSDLHRSYRIGRKSIEVLHGIDLQIHRGEKVFLCGPSGAGKTTLLYTLAGLEHPEKGRVRIDGTDLYALGRREQAKFRNQRIGYVPSYPHCSWQWQRDGASTNRYATADSQRRDRVDSD